MKAIGDLDHPNLVEALDAGESGGTVYLAMKLVEGITLGDLVNEEGPLPVAEACALARHVAQGLEYLHARGWVHRDLKPSNLPAPVAKLVARLLARDPADRPASAAEVAWLLAGFQDEGPLSQGTATETWSMETLGRRSAPVRRRLTRLGIAAAVLVGLGILASLTPSLWRREHPDTPLKSGQVPVVEVPLRVQALDVRHFARVAMADGKFDQPLGLLGKQSFAARQGDSAEVEARLSRPAYGYLIAFRPDGGEEVCYPDDESAAPPLSDRLRYRSRFGATALGCQRGVVWSSGIG